MSDSQSTLENRLIRIDTAQRRLLAVAARIDGRIDILSQEFHRTAAIIYRLSLAGEGAKAAAHRREEEMTSIRDSLARIEAFLAHQ